MYAKHFKNVLPCHICYIEVFFLMNDFLSCEEGISVINLLLGSKMCNQGFVFNTRIRAFGSQAHMKNHVSFCHVIQVFYATVVRDHFSLKTKMTINTLQIGTQQYYTELRFIMGKHRTNACARTHTDLSIEILI